MTRSNTENGWLGSMGLRLAFGLVVALAIGLMSYAAGTSPALAIVAPATVALMALFLVHPVLALLALIAIRPLVDTSLHARLAWMSWSVSLATAWGALLIIVLLAFIVRSKPARRDAASYLVPIAFIVGYAVLTFWRAGHGTAATNGGRLASAVLLTFAVELVARAPRGQALVVAALYPTAMILIVSVGIAIIRNVYGGGYYYAGAFNFQANQAPYAYAAIAILIIPFLFGAILGGARWLLPCALAALLVASVFLSFSRTAYLALALLGSAFLAAGLHFRAAKTIAAVVGTIVVATAVGTLLFPGVIANRFQHGGERLSIWGPLIHAVLASPERIAIGGGATFGRAVYGYSHNDFIGTFAAGGVVLLLLYVGYLAWIARPLSQLALANRNNPAEKGLGVVAIGAFFAFIAVSAFDGIVFSIMSLMMAMLVGLVRGMNATPNQTFVALRLLSPARIAESLLPRSRARPAAIADNRRT